MNPTSTLLSREHRIHRGLTIYWRLHSPARRAAQARRLVEQLRERALKLPFASVEEVLELRGTACQPEQLSPEDPRRWLLTQARQTVERRVNSVPRQFQVAPLHLLAFVTHPGPGCEPAYFGLCRYPSHLEIEEEQQFFVGQGYLRPSRRLPTNLTGWLWSSCCQTQYASNPKSGGTENFLRCHIAVIGLLDQAQELGLLQHVCDESGYWEQRDLQRLARTLGKWNERIAAFVGKLKDELGVGFQAPITDFPNFEHLEAKGSRAE